MGVWGSKVLGVTAVALAASLAGTASASAQDERFAEPNGDGDAGDGQCLVADPCNIQTAIEDLSVVDGDVVTLLPGSTNGVYEPQASALEVVDDITIRSREGDPVPLIPSTAGIPPAVLVAASAANATLRRFRIEYGFMGGASYALRIDGAGVTVERVFAKNARTACGLFADNILVRDSVCWTTNDNAIGVAALSSPATHTVRLRNVTAVGGPGNGIIVDANADQNITVDAVNTIAFGSPGASDVVARGEGDGSATVNLSSSNYDTRIEEPVDMDSVAVVTAPGASANQTTPPEFVNPAGDFHQLTSSTGTIDRGTSGASLLGTLDFDGNPRAIDGDCGGVAEPDIGAYELVAQCPGPPGDSPDASPPDTTITDGPQGKTKKKTATIAFSGTDARVVASFQCKLDDGSFEACTSPKTYSKLKKGEHTVEVRAVDEAGNVDPTPASRSWKVKKKKK